MYFIILLKTCFDISCFLTPECETSPLPGPSSAVAPLSCAASVASLGSTGSAVDQAAKKAEMVATLQARRAQLEAKLAAKNEELKMLCIQEADLTGVLPPEIPLEPGETPPTLRRRVGTSFTLPESLLNKLRSTEVLFSFSTYYILTSKMIIFTSFFFNPNLGGVCSSCRIRNENPNWYC